MISESKNFPLWDEFPVSLAMQQLGYHGYRVRATGGMFILPPICYVPAGPFLMGSDQQNRLAEEDERPQHWCMVDSFAMATFPVTVAEYAQAVDVDAVAPPPHLSLHG